MEAIPVVAGWAINNLSPQKILKSVGIASLLAKFDPINSSLGSRLSPNASILLPYEPNFQASVNRWQMDVGAPEISLVVKVKTEKDVEQTIRYANEHGLPFIARAGGHGATDAMEGVRNGIQIDMRDMDHVIISEDGKTARIGGGAKVRKTVSTLWDAGKETTTGICECVGIAAPVLGGGHGFNQGKYGLAADQVLEARMVLSNGTAITVSETSNPDLLWAIKGAGHNFGIVTEFKYKIYDVPPAHTWAFEFYFFTGDALEKVYTKSNEMMKTQPANVIHWTYIIKLPFDPIRPTLMYMVFMDGTASELEKYAAPIRNLKPVHVEKGAMPMPGLAAVSYMSDDSPACALGNTAIRYPIVFNEFDIPALRKMYNYYDQTMQRYPELNSSFFLLESYSDQAVKAVPEESTAFPHRNEHLLLTSALLYKPDPKLDPIAKSVGLTLRDILIQGTDEPAKLKAYVNYANGDESLQAMYGWEDWRLEKLRSLKEKWDPLNRMRYYNPIV